MKYENLTSLQFHLPSPIYNIIILNICSTFIEVDSIHVILFASNVKLNLETFRGERMSIVFTHVFPQILVIFTHYLYDCIFIPLFFSYPLGLQWHNSHNSFNGGFEQSDFLRRGYGWAGTVSSLSYDIFCLLNTKIILATLRDSHLTLSNFHKWETTKVTFSDSILCTIPFITIRVHYLPSQSCPSIISHHSAIDGINYILFKNIQVLKIKTQQSWLRKRWRWRILKDSSIYCPSNNLGWI